MSLKTPDFTFEARYSGPVCGVDEAGRGPLAGPVVAAAVILDPANLPSGLNDSKVLSHGVRELLMNDIFVMSSVGIGIAEPEEIDRANILGATMIAMRRAVENLPVKPEAALIDGNKAPPLSCQTRTLIKGDARCLSIAAASIVAKVTRDRLMVEADLRYPGYGFARHKGYATEIHRAQIKALGPCPIHRRSFMPIKMMV
ncbi:MAG: ribonuclease HII [Hellea sp.]|nr:ribonuclease HII [Hellea sp.]